MLECIKGVVDKYYTKVQKEIIGCGLGPYRDTVKREADKIAKELLDGVVGDAPNWDKSSAEYKEWYCRALVFSEIIEEVGKRDSNILSNCMTPDSLQNSYGPRD